MRFQTKSQEITTATAGRREEKPPVERVDLTYSSTYPGRGHGKRKRQTVATEPGDSTNLHIMATKVLQKSLPPYPPPHQLLSQMKKKTQWTKHHQAPPCQWHPQSWCQQNHHFQQKLLPQLHTAISHSTVLLFLLHKFQYSSWHVLLSCNVITFIWTKWLHMIRTYKNLLYRLLLDIGVALKDIWFFNEHIPLISSRPCTGRALSFNSSIRPATVLSIPFFTATGLAPEVTARRPRLMSSLASTQAVVVPSPAESFVLLATWMYRITLDCVQET